MSGNVSTINEYFDHVYVLNLKKRSDRKLSMLQKLGRLGIKAEFVQAIDGYSSQCTEEYKSYLDKDLGDHPLEIAQKRKMIGSAGAWGYLKTYYAILNDAKKRNFTRILCFDDDAVFHTDFENIFKQSVQIVPQDWKLLYLGASQHVQKIPQGLSYPDENKLQLDKNEPFYFPNSTDGSFAIGIDCSVFDFLLHYVSKMDCPFDSGPLRNVIKSYPKKSFVLNPNIVIADVSESDIQDGRNQHEVAKKLNWQLENYNYPFKKDLVSVIMPVYNGEMTIEKSIRSIMLQSYRELEIIIINDASTDKTKEIITKLMQEDDRIRLISFDENKGVYAARNEGIKASKGVAIGIQDADDISLKQRIEKQIIPIYERGVLFTISRIYRSRCKSEELDLNDQEAMMNLVESRRISKNNNYEYLDQPILGLVTSIYNKSVFKKFGLFDEFRVGGDLAYLERILFHETNNTFEEPHNGHQFIDKNYPISKTYQRFDEILLICSKMNNENITNKFKNHKSERSLQKKAFREKIIKQNLDAFIEFNSIEESEYEIPTIRYNTLAIERSFRSEDMTTLNTNGMPLAYGIDQDIKDVYNSISWKITAPLRWIGGIFLNLKETFKN